MPTQGQAQGGFDQDTLNYLRNMGLFGGAGGALGGLFNFFNQGKNPADAANKYLNQIPGQVGQYYQPYQQGGLDAYGKLQGEYGNLLGNTGDVYNRLAGGYKQSEGYQNQLREGLGAANAAAAAGGSLGSPAHQEVNQRVGQGLASQDFENYLNHQLGLYGQGLQGLGQQSQQGFDANTGYGNLLGSLLGQQGQYAYAGQAGKNAARGNSLGDIFGGLGQGLGSFFGGGIGHLFGG